MDIFTITGIGFGFLHRWHVSTLFENDRHFSHLSEIEREMSFRTEMVSSNYCFFYLQVFMAKKNMNCFRNVTNVTVLGNVLFLL